MLGKLYYVLLTMMAKPSQLLNFATIDRQDYGYLAKSEKYGPHLCLVYMRAIQLNYVKSELNIPIMSCKERVKNTSFNYVLFVKCRIRGRARPVIFAIAHVVAQPCRTNLDAVGVSLASRLNFRRGWSHPLKLSRLNRHLISSIAYTTIGLPYRTLRHNAK